MSACFVSFGALAGKALGAEPGSSAVPSGPIDAATTLGELVAHPAFNGGGLLLLPWYGRREDLEAPFSEVGSLHESMPHAQVLSEHGYNAFSLSYRAGSGDMAAEGLARAVRFVRAHASDYGIEPGAIAVMGFSAGGILAGEMLLHYAGSVTPDALDPAYVPDALDAVSADAAACGMIYSFYGWLSVASDDVEEFASAGLPPTYFCYGTRDPFVDQFELCAEALAEAGVEVDELVLPGVGHGYGALGGWIPTYDAWLAEVLARA